MRHIIKAFAIGAGLAVSAPALAAAESPKPMATLFKNPQCSCCESYAQYLRNSGYDVKVVMSHDLPLIRQRQGISSELEGCHTTLIGGYFVEGHIPVEHVNRLLKERPEIDGISVPGMPPGTPGMGGPKLGPLTIYALAANGKASVFAVD